MNTGGSDRALHLELTLLARVVEREAHVLTREPGALSSHLHNVLWLDHRDDPPAQPLLTRAREALSDRSWLQLTNRAQLGAMRRAALRVLTTPSVHRAAWSPDGEIVASTGSAGLQLWNPKSGTEVARLPGGSGPLAWSFEDELVASVGEETSVRIWSRAGSYRGEAIGHTGAIRGLAWSPEGATLASASEDHTVRLWDHAGGLKGVCSGHEGSVFPVAWSPRGSLLASGADDNTMRLWAPDGTPMGGLSEDGMDRVLCLAWHPHGTALASAGWDGTVRVWDPIGQVVMERLKGSGWALAWSPDGSLMAFGGAEGVVLLWNRAKGSLDRLEGHSGRLGRVTALAWSLDGELLASGATDNTVRLWDRTGASCGLLPGHVNWVTDLAWSPSGDVLVSVGSDGTLRLWDPTLVGPEEIQGHEEEVTRAAWAPDGSVLASGSEDGTARLWTPEGVPSAVLGGHTGEIRRVAWSPQSRYLATAGSSAFGEDASHPVRLWYRDGELRAVLDAHQRPVLDLAWSPDGAHVATAGGDAGAKLWSDEGVRINDVQFPDDVGVLAVAWSPDGQLVAFGDTLGRIVIGRVSGPSGLNFRQHRAFAGHQGRIVGLRWSPDGALLASASDDDSRVKLWKRDGGLEAEMIHADLRRESSAILLQTLDICMAWSPSSQHLATASRDAAVRVWDLEGVLREVLVGHTEQVWALAWLPDGRRLISGGADGAIRVWDLSGGEPRRLASAFSLSPVLALQSRADGRVVDAADNGIATASRPIPYVFELRGLTA